MVDMIIGAIDNYKWDQIKYWCNSIKMTGFKGRKVIVALNIDADTVNKLFSEGFEVHLCGQLDPVPMRWTYKPKLTVHVERFIHIWNFLRRQHNVDNVVMTDVRDVVFQRNPFNTAFEGCSLVAGSECLRYEDEAWGSENLLQTFGPEFHDTYKKSTIYNVGVLKGKFDYIKDLCLTIFQMGMNRPIPICDQAVFNFLLWQEPWASVVTRAAMHEGFAIHCGTVADPRKIDGFRPHLTEKTVIELVSDNVVIDTNTVPTILHQWDRVPDFKEMVEKVYG